MVKNNIQFGYWSPTIARGLVASGVDNSTGYDPDYVVSTAQLAERHGFSHTLNAIRHQGDRSEPIVASQYILGATTRLTSIAAVHPGLIHPGVLAELASSASLFSSGRFGINVVSGWHRDEFENLGEPWLDHEQRYARTGEFMEILHRLFAGGPVDFDGEYYTLHGASVTPTAPVAPALFQGGSSEAAHRVAGQQADWYFTNGGTPEELSARIAEVRAEAGKAGRPAPPVGVNSFVILRDTEEQAQSVLREIIEKFDREQVEDFFARSREAGASSPEGRGMWANSSREDLIQFNEGFRTNLIGTAEQIAGRIVDLKNIGVDLILVGALNLREELVEFGRKVIPLVREIEARDTDSERALS